jgi:hypothetical protein
MVTSPERRNQIKVVELTLTVASGKNWMLRQSSYSDRM